MPIHEPSSSRDSHARRNQRYGHALYSNDSSLNVSLNAPAHQRLYLEGETLHGDVNINTVLLIDFPDGTSQGALIDFDMPIVMSKDNQGSTVDAAKRVRPYYWRGPGL